MEVLLNGKIVYVYERVSLYTRVILLVEREREMILRGEIQGRVG